MRAKQIYSSECFTLENTGFVGGAAFWAKLRKHGRSEVLVHKAHNYIRRMLEQARRERPEFPR